jgi:hypothetical protein
VERVVERSGFEPLTSSAKAELLSRTELSPPNFFSCVRVIVLNTIWAAWLNSDIAMMWWTR